VNRREAWAIEVQGAFLVRFEMHEKMVVFESSSISVRGVNGVVDNDIRRC